MKITINCDSIPTVSEMNEALENYKKQFLEMRLREVREILEDGVPHSYKELSEKTGVSSVILSANYTAQTEIWRKVFGEDYVISVDIPSCTYYCIHFLSFIVS